MELTIDRLKVLAEEDIARLDAKIQEYKLTNCPTILDNDIRKLRIKLNDMKAIMEDLETEYNTMQTEYNTLNRELGACNTSYSEKEITLSKLTESIQMVNSELIEYPDKMTTITERLDHLATELKEKQTNVAQCKSELDAKKAEYDEATKQSIVELAAMEKQMKELHESAQIYVSAKFSDLIKFSESVQYCIAQPCMITLDIEKVLNNTLPELMKIMTKNADNYCIVREWYRDMIDDKTFERNGVSMEGCFITRRMPSLNNYSQGRYICKYNSYDKYETNPLINIHKFVCKIQIPNENWYNEFLDGHTCKHCKFIIIMRAFSIYEQRIDSGYTQKVGEYRKVNVHECNLVPYNTWLRTNYKAIFAHIIKHDKLSYIIQNTATYDELNMIFSKSGVFPMDSYNELEFMLMLAFLGNNGIPHNLYDEIVLNPDW